MAETNRPHVLYGETHNVMTGQGLTFVTLNHLPDGRLYEVFIVKDEATADDKAKCEALGRMVTLNLRNSIDPGEIARQLRAITDNPIESNGFVVRSIPDAVAQVIESYLNK